MIMGHRQHGQPAPADPNAEVFLAFGRVFSGVARDGATVQVSLLREHAAWTPFATARRPGTNRSACSLAWPACTSPVMSHDVLAALEHTLNCHICQALITTAAFLELLVLHVQVLSAAFSPAQPGEQRHKARIAGLYLMMGRGLERLSVRPLLVTPFLQLPSPGGTCVLIDDFQDTVMFWNLWASALSCPKLIH